MTNKEKYRRAFGMLHASEDILTEVKRMETKKHFSLRKAVLLCAAVVSMLHISRKDAHLGARCLVYALGGAAVVCLVLGVGVKPMIGLTRLGIDPPALKNLLIAYVGGLFGRFVVMAVIYFVLAIVLGVLVSRHKKHRA